MKKIIFSARNITGALLSSLLGLLGFSACNTHKTAKSADTPDQIERSEPTIIAMYGTPVGRYQIMKVDSVKPDEEPAEQPQDVSGS